MSRIHLLAAALAAASLVATAAPAAESKGDPHAGRALAFAECRGCHGMDGKGTSAGIPDLGGRDAGEILAALEDYRAGKRQHTPIGKIAPKAKPAELRDIAAYYAAQPAAQPSKGPK